MDGRTLVSYPVFFGNHCEMDEKGEKSIDVFVIFHYFLEGLVKYNIKVFFIILNSLRF